MLKIRSSLALLALLFSLLAADAHAQGIPSPLTNLRIVPANPIAGQPVYARLTSDGCVIGIAENVTLVGNTITLTHGWAFCVQPPDPPFDQDFLLGTLSPGSYTLVYAPAPFGSPIQPQTLGFTVGTAAVPALAREGALVLLLAAMAAGAWQLRRRRPMMQVIRKNRRA